MSDRAGQRLQRPRRFNSDNPNLEPTESASTRVTNHRTGQQPPPPSPYRPQAQALVSHLHQTRDNMRRDMHNRMYQPPPSQGGQRHTGERRPIQGSAPAPDPNSQRMREPIERNPSPGTQPGINPGQGRDHLDIP